MRISVDPSFHHVFCKLRFRSTKSITKAIDCIAEHSGQGLKEDTEKPDKLSTDVIGVMPKIMDLGGINDAYPKVNRAKYLVLVNALNKIKMNLDEEGRRDVVLLHDRFISSTVKEKVCDFARKANWQTFPTSDFTGSETDTVIFVGPGGLEPLSRARLRLYVVLMWDTEKGKKKYERYLPGFKRAISEKLMTTP